MDEVGWELWRSIPLLKDEPFRAGCSEQCLVSVWLSPRLEISQPLWEICASVQPPYERKFLLKFKWNFSYFSLWPLPAVAGHDWKESGCVLFIHPNQDLNTLIWSLLSLLFSRLNSSSSLCISSQERWSHPLIILKVLDWYLSSRAIFLMYWGAQISVFQMHLRNQYSRWISPGLMRVEWSPPSVC